MENDSIIFSGVQPSGNLHLGNYLGAIKNWVNLQEDHKSFFCVVDLHAITVPQDPQELRKKVTEIAKIYLAAGIDPTKSTIFIQSQVSAHSELAWLLNTITQNGDLTKMTQFKSKTSADFEKFEQGLSSVIKDIQLNNILPKEVTLDVTDGKNTTDVITDTINLVAENAFTFLKKRYKEQIHLFNKASVGLYDYPVLMAADILLYSTDIVPVGEDQTQHIELTRDLAKRFNHRFGETFKIPKAHIQKAGMRVMGLDDPTKKMSKSAPSKFNRIDLLDSPEEIREKIKRAVTDSGSTIEYKDERPAIKNLLNIFSLTSDRTPEELVAHFEGKGFKEFKEELAEAIVEFLTPFQERYNNISDEEVRRVLDEGKIIAEKIAQKTLSDVKQKMGL